MASFDQYEAEYRGTIERATSFSGLKLDFFTRAKVRQLLDLAARRVGQCESLTVLDVGCGSGETDALLTGKVAKLCGLDVSEAMLKRAQAANPSVNYQIYNGAQIPAAEGVFDVAFAINVLHHVLPSNWLGLVQEMTRVVRPGGMVAIFEHNPFNPLTRLVVWRVDFDRDAVLLSSRRAGRLLQEAGLRELQRDYILFFPWARPWSAALERRLRFLPLGAQYSVSALKPT